MSKTGFKYIFGPIKSWRLGSSLGVDLTTKNIKICNFDCIYCQLGRAGIRPLKRKVYVKTAAIMQELKRLTAMKVDYITFSGYGEPTLAKNLGEVIRKIKKIRPEPVAVITNSSLVYDKQVRADLDMADIVLFKLDACNEQVFKKINNPIGAISLKRVIEGLKQFRRTYKGKFALQIMFVKENINFAREIAGIANSLKPDEVQINTPTRPGGSKALSRPAILNIKEYFKAKKVVTVFDKRAPIINSKSVGNIQKRHPSAG